MGEWYWKDQGSGVVSEKFAMEERSREEINLSLKEEQILNVHCQVDWNLGSMLVDLEFDGSAKILFALEC